MKAFGVVVSAAFLSAMVATDASALPFDAAVAPPPANATLVRYGYGPLRYGLYGRHHRRHSLSNGTGYHGRGTRTGGPAGGLPGRS